MEQLSVDDGKDSGPTGRALASPGFGINLIGDFSGGIGLCVTAHAIAALLRSKNVPFSILDLRYAVGYSGRDEEFRECRVATISELTHPINLYVLPLPFFASLFIDYPEFLAKERFHVANIWWEVSKFPEQWLESLAKFDGILAMTGFIAEVCRNSLPLTPVLTGNHPLDFPSGVRSDRKEFGLPKEAIVFTASLDPNSDPARKNPAALIKAFRAAFPTTDCDLRLIIRLNNANTNRGQLVARKLDELSGEDGRIQLLLEPMTYNQILSLYACSDVYLSFHRGEGLGLGMLEAMALGKAVVATGWSGCLSFMNHGNSALLRYRLIPVSGNLEFFRLAVIGEDARWADPVHEDAVAWMRQLRHDPAQRESMGLRAKHAAEDYQRSAYEASWLAELKHLWLAQRHLPRVVEKYSYSSASN